MILIDNGILATLVQGILALALSYLAKSRSASRDMVMLVRFCCRTKMFLHIFLMPDSLMRLKYWAPLMRMQEIRWPRPEGPAQISGGKREDRLVPPCMNLHMNLEGFLSSLPSQIYMTKENISLRAAAPTGPTIVLEYLYIVLIVTNGEALWT